MATKGPQRPQPTTPRKLRVPGKLIITPPQPEEPVQIVPPPPPPACVAPRRRFLKWFLAITGVITLLGNLIVYFRCETASSEPEVNLFLLIAGFFMSTGSLAMFEAPVFGLLAIPARTSRGSLFQLIGLILPLLVAISSCALSDVDTTVAWGYGAFMFMLCGGGMLFFYLPGCLLHFGLTFISKNRHRS